MRADVPLSEASLALSAFASPIVAREQEKMTQSVSLAELALQKVLSDASPIFGDFGASATSPNTSTWMSSYPDSTLIVHMNLPGTHDSSTWNYSLATQEALLHVTDLNNVTMYPPEIFRCQELDFYDMLEAGIRVSDLRFAFDTTNSTLVFYHSQALQSETATIEDVLFAFYQWLDLHPNRGRPALLPIRVKHKGICQQRRYCPAEHVQHSDLPIRAAVLRPSQE